MFLYPWLSINWLHCMCNACLSVSMMWILEPTGFLFIPQTSNYLVSNDDGFSTAVVQMFSPPSDERGGERSQSFQTLPSTIVACSLLCEYVGIIQIWIGGHEFASVVCLPVHMDEWACASGRTGSNRDDSIQLQIYKNQTTFTAESKPLPSPPYSCSCISIMKTM